MKKMKKQNMKKYVRAEFFRIGYPRNWYVFVDVMNVWFLIKFPGKTIFFT